MQTFWCTTCHTFFLILSRYVVFFNDITNQTIFKILKKYTNSDTKITFKKNTLIAILKLHLKENTQIACLPACEFTFKQEIIKFWGYRFLKLFSKKHPFY